MKVSVVLPVYNGQRFIRETLDSVLNQTYPATEVIVVDDGSTDDSLEVLGKYGRDISVVKQENAGVSAARNRGAQVATGDWLAFVDQDDIWYAHKLESQLQVFQANDTQPLVYSDFDLIDSQGLVTRRCALGQLRAKWMCPFIGGHLHPYPSTVLMKKSFFLEVGGFDPHFKENGHEDVDLWIRLYDKVPFVLIPEALIQYRLDHQHRKKKRRSLEVEAANGLYLYQKLESRFRNDPSKKEAMDRLLSVALANQGKVLLLNGELQEARGCFREAYRACPQQKRNWWRYWRTFLPAVLHRYIFSN
jgi:glycosyltransferase involved in cell wall biosynthesis